MPNTEVVKENLTPKAGEKNFVVHFISVLGKKNLQKILDMDQREKKALKVNPSRVIPSSLKSADALQPLSTHNNYF